MSLSLPSDFSSEDTTDSHTFSDSYPQERERVVVFATRVLPFFHTH